MNLEDEIKKEIYQYILKFDLDKDELKEVDTYVLNLLKNFKVILESHDKLINNKENINKLKSVILKDIGS